MLAVVLVAVLGVAPVRLPVTYTDLLNTARWPYSAAATDPVPGDVMVIKCGWWIFRNYEVVWPYFTVARDSTLLTEHLLGSDNERVLTELGYSDRDTTDWYVTLVHIYLRSDSEELCSRRIEGPISKAKFDQKYGTYSWPTGIPVGIRIPKPDPPPPFHFPPPEVP